MKHFFLQGQKKIDWHDNLKALLVRKAFLVYVTLSEAYFAEENYGQCVKLLKRALNCYFCFLKISDHANATNVKMLLSFAYGVAGIVHKLFLLDYSTGLSISI